MTLTLVPFESLGAVSYSPSIVTVAVSVAVCEIFSVKEWRDFENQVRGRSRSLKWRRSIDHMRPPFFNFNTPISSKLIELGIEIRYAGGCVDLQLVKLGYQRPTSSR